MTRINDSRFSIIARRARLTGAFTTNECTTNECTTYGSTLTEMRAP